MKHRGKGEGQKNGEGNERKEPVKEQGCRRRRKMVEERQWTVGETERSRCSENGGHSRKSETKER